MDNRRNLPGYKYYTDAGATGPGSTWRSWTSVDGPRSAPAVNGLCLPVDDAIWSGSTGVSATTTEPTCPIGVAVGAPDGARVWAYIGTVAARARLAEGRRTGAAVIDAGYVRTVEAGFAALGAAELTPVRSSLAPGDLPVVELTRHALSVARRSPVRAGPGLSPR